MKGIVDRIEGCVAVCEMDGKERIELALDVFEQPPREGDVISYMEGKAIILPGETQERKEKVQSLFDRLKKKGK